MINSFLDKMQRYITDSPSANENEREPKPGELQNRNQKNAINVASQQGYPSEGAKQTTENFIPTTAMARSPLSDRIEENRDATPALLPLLWQTFRPEEREQLRRNSITLEALAGCSMEEKFVLLVHYLVYTKLNNRNPSPQVARSALCELGVSPFFLAGISQQIDLRNLCVHSFADIFIDIKKPLLEFSSRYKSLYAPTKKFILRNISASEYQHPLDTQYLHILQSTKGIDYIFKKITEHGIEPFIRVNCIGSYLQVTKDIMPDIYALLEQACAILEIPEIPGLYVKQGFIGGDTRADVKPLIVIDSMSLSILSRDELLFLIGHELGHIKSSHLRYRMMSEALPILSDVVGAATLGIGKLVSLGVTLALDNWYRMSEFTADRAGLLCCQNLNAALTIFMKLSGLPVRYYNSCPSLLEPFKAQAHAFTSLDESNMNKFIKYASILGETHPWIIMRVKELLNWQESGAYQALLEKHCPKEYKRQQFH